MYTIIDKQMTYQELHDSYPNRRALIYGKDVSEINTDSKDSILNVFSVDDSSTAIKFFRATHAGYIFTVIPTSPVDLELPMFEDDYKRLYGGC